MYMKRPHLILVLPCALVLQFCIPKAYVKVPESISDSESVRIPRGQARQVKILAIDDYIFQGLNNDLIYLSPGKHAFRISAFDLGELETTLTRVVKAGTVIQICPGLNRNKFSNKAFPEKERWTPFVRTIDENSFTEAMGMMNQEECLWGFGRKDPHVLE